MNILALDLSLTATGLCHPDGSTETIIADKLRGMGRLQHIESRALYCAAYADVVAIEGYSHGSPKQAVYLGELGGVIRLALWRNDIPYADIPPTCRAKYATGKGNAGKDAVIQQAALKAGHAFGDNNQADAWWLWQMALAHYEPDSPLLVKVPAVNREGLSKVQWPVIESKGA